MKRPPKTLDAMLYDLLESGHRPSLYFRGDVFRAHVDAGDNLWADDKSPSSAMYRAILNEAPRTILLCQHCAEDYTSRLSGGLWPERCPECGMVELLSEYFA